MKYNFDKEIDRRNTGSLKWDVKENELPMWVADMDFQTAPEVTDAIKKKAQNGIFGYQIVSENWYEAIQNWWKNRHDFNIEKQWLCFCTGVVPAISSSVKRITNIGDNVLVQTPVYDIFFHSIENAGRHVLENQLIYQNGEYKINFEDLEEKLSRPLTTTMILCNPHNPVGKIWSKDELKLIGSLCRKYHVTVLSDEIHCDLTDPGLSYIPFASVSEECRKISITCVSASKAFNIAGLQSAAVIIPDENIRNKVVRGLNSDEVAEPNAFAIESAVAAFTKGEQWLDELREYIYNNKKVVQDYIKKEIPDINVISSEATYLLWLDCSKISEDSSELVKYIREKTGLYLSCGSQYRGNGKMFLRMNIACPKARVQKGLKLLKKGILSYRDM